MPGAATFPRNRPRWSSSKPTRWRCWQRRRCTTASIPGAPGNRYQVVVHVDAPALADAEAPGESVLENGEHVPAETSRRLPCDASRVGMQPARDARVVDASGRTRTTPLALLPAHHHR